MTDEGRGAMICSYQKSVRLLALLEPLVAELKSLLPILSGDSILNGSYAPLADARVRHGRADLASTEMGEATKKKRS